ncbi:LuxR C-terminal-related transcriptional regulator [Streptomyces sp. NPDC047046]|uniref:helix-turn-helix transcriptional regulator n=1 Tax=Streptomyces sp. NPDC047046 TaxID=3155378 RepID=UPI00340A2385
MLGLDGLEESIYRRILRRSGQRIRELVDALDSEEAEVRGAISRLVSMSLIRRSWEDDNLLLPISPEVAVGSLLADQEARLLRQQHELQHSRASLAKLVSEYATVGFVPGDNCVQRIEGIDAVRTRIEELVHRSSTEIISFNSGTYESGALEAGRVTDQDALSRGVLLRSIYLESARNRGTIRDHLRWLVKSGAEIRLAPALPVNLIVFDGRTALLPIDPADRQAGALVVTGPAVLVALLALFEHHWEAASAFDVPSPCSAGSELTAGETELLRLLAKGFTDEAVGRQLGVSQRTVRRRIADLTDRLGAGSRFQAGVLAGRRGWL